MSSIVSKFRHSLMLVGAGAVAAYYLDPDKGADRRRSVKRRFGALVGAKEDVGQVVDMFANSSADTSRRVGGLSSTEDASHEGASSPQPGASTAPSGGGTSASTASSGGGMELGDSSFSGSGARLRSESKAEEST